MGSARCSSMTTPASPTSRSTRAIPTRPLRGDVSASTQRLRLRRRRPGQRPLEEHRRRRATWTKLAGNGLPTGEYGRIGISIYRKNSNVVFVSIEQGARYNASTAYIQSQGRPLPQRRQGRERGRSCPTGTRVRCTPASRSSTRNDDKRIYMLNAYSFSDDGGKTFTAPRTTHARRRSLRVGRTRRTAGTSSSSTTAASASATTAATSSSTSRRCRCRSSTAWRSTTPCRSTSTAACRTTAAGWARAPAGPPTASSTSTGRASAAATASWRCPIPSTPGVVFSASQFLGLQRNNTRTWEAQDIRPGDPHGTHRGPPQLGHVGQAGRHAGARQRHASRPTGTRRSSCRRTTRARSTRACQHLFRSRDRGADVGRPRRHDHRRRSRRRCR